MYTANKRWQKTQFSDDRSYDGVKIAEITVPGMTVGGSFQDSSPSPMVDVHYSSVPSDLTSDILLLSTFLEGQQTSSSTSHPSDKALALYSDISTLLAIGNCRHPRAQNVNAVMGSLNMQHESTALEVIVCAENARQTKAGQTDKMKVGEMPQKGSGTIAGEFGSSDSIFRGVVDAEVKMEGRVYLDKWNAETLDMTEVDHDKYVVFFLNVDPL